MTSPDFQYSSTSEPVPELTVLAVLLGIVVGIVMSVANVYLGLFAGMTVSASIPAAVISMGLLKGVLKRGTILENNMVQTMASAGESLAAGIIFTMPALIIAGVWTEFDYWTTTIVALAGGLLGVLFMIPLRRPMIVEDDSLIYPEGVACAKVLRAGESGGNGMKVVFGALCLGTVIKIMGEGLGILVGGLKTSFIVGPTKFFTGLTASPALIAVGYIVGFNISALVFVGGALAWALTAPVLVALGNYDVALVSDDLYSLVKADVRYLGVGAMIVGGLWSILQIRHGIAQGIRETMGSYSASINRQEIPRTERDMDRRWLLLLTLATAIVVLFLYRSVSDSWMVSALATPLMLVCSFFFVAVASYIVGLVGSSNSPVSGMTICSVLLTSAIIALFGFSPEVAIMATMGVAGVVCCATCTAGDVCQDLKTGSLVGATPYRQQWAEIIGVITASFVMAPVLGLLHSAYGIGTGAEGALEAPQAQLFASLMQGFFGDAELPWGLIGIGAALGLVIILLDKLVLEPRKSKFRLFVMPVAVGMYLPFGLSTAILLGGLVAWAAARRHKSAEKRDQGHEQGILLSSGLIAGEAIAGVLIAIPKAAEYELPNLQSSNSTIITVIAMFFVVQLLFKIGTKKT
jgi:putative OPT family oligopeptide transporter